MPDGKYIILVGKSEGKGEQGCMGVLFKWPLKTAGGACGSVVG
jgi:hypothetical protein